MEVQVFGIKKSAETRAALRFFAPRIRPASRGELLRFAQRFGVEALIDRDSRRFAELGLAPARYSDDRWLEKLAEEPALLRLPLVRAGKELAIGAASAAWAG